MPWEWKDSECKELYKISEEKIICGVIRHKKSEQFSCQTQFKTINEVALKTKIFDRSLFNKAEELRQKRNRIHLTALEEIDDLYEKKDTQEAFQTAKDIIEQIEIKLKEIL